MAWDYEQAASRAVKDGPDLRPLEPVPGRHYAAGRHIRERFGAVLFLRVSRTGEWGDEAGVVVIDADDIRPGSHGGSLGWPDPYAERAPELLRELGRFGRDVELDGEWRPVTAIHGDCGDSVHRIHFETPDDAGTVVVDGEWRVFVIAYEGDGDLPITLTALDEFGAPIATIRA